MSCSPVETNRTYLRWNSMVDFLIFHYIGIRILADPSLLLVHLIISIYTSQKQCLTLFPFRNNPPSLPPYVSIVASPDHLLKTRHWTLVLYRPLIEATCTRSEIAHVGLRPTWTERNRCQNL